MDAWWCHIRLTMLAVGLLLQAGAMVGITVTRASDPPWTVALVAAIVITLGGAYPSGWPPQQTRHVG